MQGCVGSIDRIEFPISACLSDRDNAPHIEVDAEEQGGATWETQHFDISRDTAGNSSAAGCRRAMRDSSNAKPLCSACRWVYNRWTNPQQRIPAMPSEQPMSTQPQSDLSQSGSWDYEAYAAIPNDGKRHEVIGGVHFVNPAPNLYHQELSRRIQYQLYSAIELTDLGVVINAPVDVQLGTHDIVQPDLVVITRGRQQIMTPAKVRGAPDLLIEILSPSNPGHDLVTKRQTYLQHGVPEYWIVSPDDNVVFQLILAGGKYLETRHQQSITMHVPPNVTVDLTKVW